MKAVIQRVNRAQVIVEEEIIGAINKGILLLLGISEDDSSDNISWMVNKIKNLRIFSDEDGKMNLSLDDVNGQLLIVSQFTLYGDCKRGRRPSYSKAAKPEKAEEIYNLFITEVEKQEISYATGKFGAHMKIDLVNDGPVTLIVENE